MSSNAAVIGISGRRLPGTRMPAMEPRYQVRDIDMYFSDYARRIADQGGIPVQIPYDADPAAIVSRLDGLLVTGGQDISPNLWGGDPSDAAGDVDSARDFYELALIAAAEERGIAVLGICRGMQLLNVGRGGSLVPDLPSEVMDHRAKGHDVDYVAHDVQTEPGSLARQVYGDQVKVNSLHHQAVDRPGDGVVISGRSSDGVAEVIEVPGHKMFGVQWHPEWMPGPDACFAWLVGEALAVTSAGNVS